MYNATNVNFKSGIQFALLIALIFYKRHTNFLASGVVVLSTGDVDKAAPNNTILLQVMEQFLTGDADLEKKKQYFIPIRN
jgi:hypothetical protein